MRVKRATPTERRDKKQDKKRDKKAHYKELNKDKKNHKERKPKMHSHRDGDEPTRIDKEAQDLKPFLE